MKVAAIQMVSEISVDHNLAQAHRLLDQAAAAGAELAVLPEYFCFMGRNDRDKLLLAETPGLGTVQDFLSDTARELGIWIVGGTLPMAIDDPERAANACMVYNPRGKVAARYDKIHLFRYDNGRERYDEAAALVAGEQPTAFTLHDQGGQDWRVGLSVCYDLRFPELYRQLGADIIVVPSAFTHTTGQAHWEVLLRARAIENQSYVIASAQGGLHENGRQTWGQTMIIDPWGSVLGQHATGAGMVVCEIDPARLQSVRQQLPALQHRRL
ncbi:MAG: hypothetical protein RLZZ555_404 [Pseudomonadota bacterium]|jgi:nitrilase